MTDLYKQRGVSAQKEDVHEAIKHLDKGLYPDAFCHILPDYLTGDEAHCCIMHADTAGTKSILAYLYWKETGDLSVWKGIAQDAIVMNIDDMICAGAGSEFILSSTIARNKHLIPGEVLSAVIGGCHELLSEWKQYGIHIHMAGGETADVGDLVKTIDVGYTAFARFKRNQVIRIQPQPGDVLVGFASFGQSVYETSFNSGIGCNGLTSARHDILSKHYMRYTETYDTALPENVCYIGKHLLTDTVEQNMSIGKLLLSPTRTFAPLVKQIIELHGKDVHGIVHNTGGGQTKCLKYIPEQVRIVKDNLFAQPLIFKLIQEASGIDYQEMYQVFNMGSRLEIYTTPEAAAGMIELANKLHIDAQIVGRVEPSATKELRIHSEFGEFRYA
jgi:phosphoribosylformylglycinamidine cyclo-ligase